MSEISEAAWHLAYRKNCIVRFDRMSARMSGAMRFYGVACDILPEQALAAQAELNAADEVTDAEVSRLSEKYVKGNTIFDNADEVTRWILEDYEAAKKARGA